MGKPAPKPSLAAVPPSPAAAPARTAAAEKRAPAPPAHPAHQPKRTGTPARTHDPGHPRATTEDAWADLHPQRVWPD